MAKTGLLNVTANNTFQVWLDRTNELVDLMGTDVITASVGGDNTGTLVTPKTANLFGTFSANTVIANTILKADTIDDVSGSGITFDTPVTIDSASETVAFEAFSNSVDPVIRINNNTVSWDVGFDGDSQSFIINDGSSVDRLKLTPAGNLTVTGKITAGTGGFVGNVTGNLTGNVTGDLTGDVTGNVTGNLTGNVTGDLTGDVTGNVTGNLTGDVTGNADTAANLVGLTSSITELNTLNGIDTAGIGFGYVPQGGIIMWSGAISAIPSGWALCDGTDGTPDLTGRFVVHADADAGGTYAPGDTGGADDVTLTEAQMPRHTHNVTGSTSESGEHNHTVTTLGANFGVFGGSGGSNAGNTTRTTSLGGLHAHTISGTAAATGGGSAHENRPPYYALAYIMKL